MANMAYKNKFLQDYAKPGQHGSPRNKKEQKENIRQYPNNNPKTAKGKTNSVNEA
tara:strand:+ start:247 stop:411 length:165 start_codon:yes stop_codon:yes gene_type:complete